MKELSIKKGDTFNFKISLKDENQQPLNLLVTDVQSQVRQKNGILVQDLNIELIQAGEFKIFSQNTSTYPVGILEIDVRVKQGAESFATETILLKVEKSVTVWKSL